MPVPDEKQAAELARLDAEVVRRQKDYEAPRPELAAKWEQAVREAIAAETNWTVLTPEKMVAESSVKLTADKEQVISSAEKDPKDGKDTYRITVNADLKDVVGFRLEALSAEHLPGHGPGRAPDGNFVITGFRVEEGTNKIALAEATATFEAKGFPAAAVLK